LAAKRLPQPATGFSFKQMATASPIPEDTSIADGATADLAVFVTAMPAEQFKGVLANLETAFSQENIIVATQNAPPTDLPVNLRIIPTPQTNPLWMLKPADFVVAAQCGLEHTAKAILILGPGADSLSSFALRSLADAVLTASIDLAVPHYALPPHTGLINSAILYPLTRAVFASRVRFPLSIDLAVSPRMAERLAASAQRTPVSDSGEVLLWPVNEAVAAGFTFDEVDAGSRTVPQPSDPDINSMLALITGSLFADIEAKAALWQRPRRAPAIRVTSADVALSDGSTDVARMVAAFRLATDNLQEVWSLVLPPNSLLMLKRCSMIDPAEFRLPDNLWARIVFDFLIAYRLRTINRGHLLGALIPLYLAWVAGHINVIASGTPAERHIEAVAAAFEADKSYLVARWRWPDRFNS
jgi:glucosylglycerate synthase